MEIYNLLKICDCYNIDFLWLNVDYLILNCFNFYEYCLYDILINGLLCMCIDVCYI